MSRTRAPGEFCWINVLTADPAAERDFFAKLLRWEYVEIPGRGHRIRVGGHDVGGIFDLAATGAPPGTPAGIGVMVRVTDADAVSRKAAALGGRGKPAFDIGPLGRMAECADPLGAMFDLWQPGTSQGMTVDGAEHGAPTWFETMTTDVGRARRFYADLFGWTPETMPGPGGYVSFRLGELAVAGALAITPEMGAIPPHWAVYFAVDDVDATVARAGSLGASTFLPPRDIPGVARFAGIMSPRGVHFYVIRMDRRP